MPAPNRLTASGGAFGAVVIGLKRRSPAAAGLSSRDGRTVGVKVRRHHLCTTQRLGSRPWRTLVPPFPLLPLAASGANRQPPSTPVYSRPRAQDIATPIPRGCRNSSCSSEVAMRAHPGPHAATARSAIAAPGRPPRQPDGARQRSARLSTWTSSAIALGAWPKSIAPQPMQRASPTTSRPPFVRSGFCTTSPKRRATTPWRTKQQDRSSHDDHYRFPTASRVRHRAHPAGEVLPSLRYEAGRSEPARYATVASRARTPSWKSEVALARLNGRARSLHRWAARPGYEAVAEATEGIMKKRPHSCGAFFLLLPRTHDEK